MGVFFVPSSDKLEFLSSRRFVYMYLIIRMISTVSSHTLQDLNYFGELIKEFLSKATYLILSVSLSDGWLIAGLWDGPTFATCLTPSSSDQQQILGPSERIALDFLTSKSILKVLTNILTNILTSNNYVLLVNVETNVHVYIVYLVILSEFVCFFVGKLLLPFIAT